MVTVHLLCLEAVKGAISSFLAASEMFLHFRLVFLSRWVIHLSHAEADLNIMVQLPNAGFSFRRTSLNRNKCLYVL